MDELYKLLPDEYAAAIKTLSIAKLEEVRIIGGEPVRVRYDGKYRFLCSRGITDNIAAAFTADKTEAENVVMRACKRSLYTVTDTLLRGYVPVSGGIRVGVCGSGVSVGGKLAAVKDFRSVNIRIPHEIKGCAISTANYIARGARVKNTLVVSPPGAGKTTLLRDLCRLLSDGGRSVLLCDEKFELACVSGGASLDVGRCTDVISGVSKAQAFEMGIACMRPDVIIADELFGTDMESVRRASACGISVIASVHAATIDDLKKKGGFINSGVWECHAYLQGAPTYGVRLKEAEHDD